MLLVRSQIGAHYSVVMTYTNPYDQPEPADECAHDWEYSEQSEPHKGREYFTCRSCSTTAATDPATGELIYLPA